MQARALHSDEAGVWRTLRLEALSLYPGAFLTTYDEAKALPTEVIAKRLASGNMFGVFSDTLCCGIGSLLPQTRQQCRHRADIAAFFVQPAAHGKGAGDALMIGLLKRA